MKTTKKRMIQRHVGNSDQQRNIEPFYFRHNLYLSIVEFRPRFLCNDFNLDFLNPDKTSRNVLHGTIYQPSMCSKLRKKAYLFWLQKGECCVSIFLIIWQVGQGRLLWVKVIILHKSYCELSPLMQHTTFTFGPATSFNFKILTVTI